MYVLVRDDGYQLARKFPWQETAHMQAFYMERITGHKYNVLYFVDKPGKRATIEDMRRD